MQQGRPTLLTSRSKEVQIQHLQNQIKILEAQLDNAKRDHDRLKRDPLC